ALLHVNSGPEERNRVLGFALRLIQRGKKNCAVRTIGVVLSQSTKTNRADLCKQRRCLGDLVLQEINRAQVCHCAQSVRMFISLLPSAQSHRAFQLWLGPRECT